MPAYLKQKEIQQFKKDGFLLIREVFDVNELSQLRKSFLNAFDSGLWKSAPNSNLTIINDIFNYFPDFVHQLFNKKFFTIIKELIGDNAVWIPECSIHRNRFIHWHKDTSIQELHGEHSHKDYSSPLIQAAIYFQDNGEDGGGLTVLPGTHKTADHYQSMLSSNLVQKSYYKFLKTIKLSSFDKAEKNSAKIDIPTKMGDLLLFDLRIDHRSTFPTTKQPISIDKLAIFNTFGADNNVTKRYFEFMKNRPEPYYKYFREISLPEIVYQKGYDLNMTVWY